MWGGRPIVFHHVPKCGGTSIGRALRRAYIFSQGTVKPHESSLAFEAARCAGRTSGDVYELREGMLLYLLYCRVRCIAAHVPFSDVAFENFSDRYAFVTVLRDPVERFVSNFYWNRRSAGAATPEALAEFMRTSEARRMGSTYVRYFCGHPGRPEFTSADVDRAIHNLRRMTLVGSLGELQTFERELRQITGRRLKVGRENVGRNRPTDELPARLRAQVLSLCAPDRAIWDAVQHMRSTAAAVLAGPPT